MISDYYNIDVNKVADYMKATHPDIQCRLTFTNMLVDNEMLNDKTGNELLKLFHFGNNGISVILDIFVVEVVVSMILTLKAEQNNLMKK